MAEKTDRKKTVYLTDPPEFWCMMDNPAYEILDIEVCSEEMVRVEYKDGAATQEDVPPYQNVAYAALTTVSILS